MAKLERIGRAKSFVAKSKDEQIVAAMSKAIREVKRRAAFENVKLAVASSKDWLASK